MGWRVVLRLGVKELWSLWRDPAMLVLIVYMFTVAIYSAATAMPDTLHNTSVAIVDEDRSPLSGRLASAFYPPHYLPPHDIPLTDVDPSLDRGLYTFVLVIPAGFQRDVLAGRTPALQLNVDATRMSQAFTGSGFIQQIVQGEIAEFLQRHRGVPPAPVALVERVRFNPSLEPAWFGGLTEVINSITLLSIILTGAALIREREHGTIEHLLVMPVTPLQIMLSKVASMSLVVLLACFVSMTLVVQGAIGVPVQGSLWLFFACVALHLFATTSMGMFMATVARSMPQFGLLLILVLLPLEMLSGGQTPRESMPALVQDVMWLAPTTHFVMLGQAVLFRGAGLAVVWPSMLALAGIGAVLFVLALRRFRRTLGQMA